MLQALKRFAEVKYKYGYTMYFPSVVKDILSALDITLVIDRPFINPFQCSVLSLSYFAVVNINLWRARFRRFSNMLARTWFHLGCSC